MLLDNVILVYKVINDIIVYVVGNAAENELILQSVLQALDETLANLLKYEHTHEGRGSDADETNAHLDVDADADAMRCGCARATDGTAAATSQSP